MISLTLETLSNGQMRATVRQDGRTVAYRTGAQGQRRELCLAVLHDGASAHQIGPDQFDFTHIRVNAAARQALGRTA